MQSFAYTVRNATGHLLTGTLQAQSRQAAVSTLRDQRYFPLSVEPANRFLQRTGLGTRFRTQERALFIQQLATLLRAGMRLSLALQSLARQSENKKLIAVVEQLHKDVEGSSSLSDAMAKHPRAFPAACTAVVSAAEETGTLPEALANLSKQLKAQVAVHARVRGAMIYPLFLLVVGGLVVTVLVGFVVPRFVELFVNAGQRLPLPTRILVGSVDVLRQLWWSIPLFAAGLGAIFCLMLRQEHTRLSFDRLLLSMPLVGALNRKLQQARFARILGSLLDGGVRVAPAMDIAAKTMTNRAFSAAVAGIGASITKGNPIAQALREQKYFSEITVNMVAVGEETGALPEMLLEVADIYDQESESAIGALTNLLGPIMIVVLGIVIGFVVLAILLPIFETSAIIT